jgi:alpha-ketoglutarate-dependent taurine dioxygenase
MNKNDMEADLAFKKKSFAERRKLTRPKAVSVSAENLVEVDFLEPGRTLPLVLRPAVPGINLPDWVRSNQELIESNLLKYGGLLFRGFGIRGVSDFKEFLDASSIELMHYMESATPRTELSEKVYTSTEFPSQQAIALHNELTYVSTWPMKIWFLSITPAQSGGETPIADVRKVLDRLDAGVKDRFMKKGWMLVRNFGDGLGLPWQTSFHTNDKAEVEDYFNNSQIEFEWKDGDRLRTRQVRPAVARHPKTGEMVWFNHVAFWHVSSLDDQVREAMLSVFREDELPYSTYY